MASNEDILIQFSAEDGISSVIEAMGDSVNATVESIIQTMDALDVGLNNLTTTSGVVSSAFGELESGIESLVSSFGNLQSSIDNVDGSNISNVSSDMGELGSAVSGAIGEVDNLSTSLSSIDGTTISVDIEANGISGGDVGLDYDQEFGGETTEQDTSALRSSMYDDMVKSSETLKEIGYGAVDAASAAEQGWLRLGNAVEITGGNWETQSENIKSWTKDFSNSMGRGVADTRTAMTTFMNMGMNLEQTQETMKVVSNYAAQFGINQSQAAQQIQMAFMGAGRGVKKLGLDIGEFKDEAGNVDRERLLQAMMEKTTGAAEKYSDTYEARVQRMNNAINSLRTDFGKEIIGVLEQLLPIVQTAFSAFTSLPGPIKSVLLGFAGLAGSAAIVAGPLIKMRAYMRMGGVEIGSLRKGLSTLRVGFNSLSNGGLKQAISNMRTFSQISKATGNTGFMVSGPSTPVNLPKTGGIAKGTTTVVKDASTVGKLAPTATTAASGMGATSGALAGISSAFTSMIVPLLAIAAVVAVMIPIIAGLAAEALIFIKGIQILIEALDFDSIDLTGAIEGIKQIGRAMFEVGVAMAEMTFANLLTGLAVLTSGVPGLINPIQIAGGMLLQAANELQVFNSVQIDESVPDNIQKISDTLKIVSDAMGSLTNVVLDMALGNIATLGGLLGNVSDAMRTAKTEIVYAGQQISEIKNVPDLDEGAVDKLKKVSSALESVATAMDSLRSLRDAYNWDNLFSGLTNLFGGVNIQQALLDVREDVYRASAALSQFNGVTDIPEGVSEKLKKVADSLKSVSESIESLRKLRDDYNWDEGIGGIFQGKDIVGTLEGVRTDIIKVSQKLATLKSVADIPEGTTEKLKNVSSTLKKVLKVIEDMKEFKGQGEGQTGGDFSSIVTTISNARKSIVKVSTQLKTLGTQISDVPEDTVSKIKNVSRGIKTTSKSVEGMKSFPVLSGNEIPARVQKAVIVLKNSARYLAEMKSAPSVSGDIVTKIINIGLGSTALKGVVNPLKSFPVVSGNEIPNRVKKAVTMVKATANQLNALKGAKGVSGINQILSSVSSAVKRLRTTLNNMRGGFRSSGVNIGRGIKTGIKAGLSGLNGQVSSIVNVAINRGVSIGLSGGARIGSRATSGFKNTFKISTIVASELTFSQQAVQSGTDGVVNAVHDMAQKAVDEMKNTLDQQSPGKMARMLGDEMGYGAQLINSQGAKTVLASRNIAQRIVTAFNPNLQNPLESINTNLGVDRLNAVRNMRTSSEMGRVQRPVNIQIGEGAVQLDARNMTTKESQQVMLNALEGLNVIDSINVRGV